MALIGGYAIAHGMDNVMDDSEAEILRNLNAVFIDTKGRYKPDGVYYREDRPKVVDPNAPYIYQYLRHKQFDKGGLRVGAGTEAPCRDPKVPYINPQSEQRYCLSPCKDNQSRNPQTNRCFTNKAVRRRRMKCRPGYVRLAGKTRCQKKNKLGNQAGYIVEDGDEQGNVEGEVQLGMAGDPFGGPQHDEADGFVIPDNLPNIEFFDGDLQNFDLTLLELEGEGAGANLNNQDEEGAKDADNLLNHLKDTLKDVKKQKVFITNEAKKVKITATKDVFDKALQDIIDAEETITLAYNDASNQAYANDRRDEVQVHELLDKIEKIKLQVNRIVEDARDVEVAMEQAQAWEPEW